LGIDEDHKILGLDNTMSFEEKQKVFHALVQKKHPDKSNGENEERMKDITCAWDRIEQFYGEKNALTLRKSEMVAQANEFREIISYKEGIKQDFVHQINQERNGRLYELKADQKKKSIIVFSILAFFLIFFSIFQYMSSLLANMTIPLEIIGTATVAYSIFDIYWRYSEKVEEINNNSDEKINQIYNVIFHKKMVFQIHSELIKKYHGDAGLSEREIIDLILDSSERDFSKDFGSSQKYGEYVLYTLLEWGCVGRLYYENEIRYFPIPL
jgi:curved DNA-binding protein CbpA